MRCLKALRVIVCGISYLCANLVDGFLVKVHRKLDSPVHLLGLTKD